MRPRGIAKSEIGRKAGVDVQRRTDEDLTAASEYGEEAELT